MADIGILIGRFCPVHRGHERVIQAMTGRFGAANCLIGIGSCNHPPSIRHFFSYRERREFLRIIFPELKIFGIPDYHSDDDWMLALDDTLRAGGIDPQAATFFGGCREEVDYFFRFGRKVEILNRFDGSSPKISATEVRDALIQGRGVEHLLNPLIAGAVTRCFAEKWEQFKKM